MFSILIVKETRAGETRVAMTPADVSELTRLGHAVYVESNAGRAAGFLDQDYVNANAHIRQLKDQSPKSFNYLFSDITHVVRVKRPERAREILESQSIAKNTLMIGALDPLEEYSPHLEEYQRAGIEMHSIDQLALPNDHPMNILSAMSKIAGRLALYDALKKMQRSVNKIVIIGFGSAGQSAFDEAVKLKLPVSVMLRNKNQMREITNAGGIAILIDNNIGAEVSNADIVITAARKNNESAPILITQQILQQMRAGTIIVDLALSEGGNVAGSKHDQTLTLGNDVIVTNISGYPKAEPHTASVLWSQATLLYLQHLILSIKQRGSYHENKKAI